MSTQIRLHKNSAGTKEKASLNIINRRENLFLLYLCLNISKWKEENFLAEPKKCENPMVSLKILEGFQSVLFSLKNVLTRHRRRCCEYDDKENNFN